MKEMEKAKEQMREREEKKAVTKGAGGGPAEPKVKLTVSGMIGGVWPGCSFFFRLRR